MSAVNHLDAPQRSSLPRRLIAWRPLGQASIGSFASRVRRQRAPSNRARFGRGQPLCWIQSTSLSLARRWTHVSLAEPARTMGSSPDSPRLRRAAEPLLLQMTFSARNVGEVNRVSPITFRSPEVRYANELICIPPSSLKRHRRDLNPTISRKRPKSQSGSLPGNVVGSGPGRPKPSLQILKLSQFPINSPAVVRTLAGVALPALNGKSVPAGGRLVLRATSPAFSSTRRWSPG